MALPASLEMFAQSKARGFGVAPLDCLIDTPVLRLDLLQIKPALLRGLRLRTDGSRRNDAGSQRMQNLSKYGLPVAAEIAR